MARRKAPVNKTVYVSTTEGLIDALSTAKGGETILMRGGEYEAIDLWNSERDSLDFSKSVTVRSADTDDPAVIDGLRLANASNIVFDSLVFDYDADPGDSIKDRLVRIRHTEDITIRNSIFDGDLAEGVDARSNGFATGHGLGIGQSSNVLIENNVIYGFRKGIGIGSSEEITVRGNDIHSIRIDGITSTKSSHVTIEENYIHDFARKLAAGDHPDMIQFWTDRNREATTDIIIRNNVLDIGEGQHTQSIFMGNEAVTRQGKGEKMYYQDVEISGNVILNAHLNGIFVGASNGLDVTDNAVLQADGATPRDLGARELPQLRIDKRSDDVSILSNYVSKITGAARNPDWAVEDNAIMQNVKSSKAGYYEDAFDVLSGSDLAARYDDVRGSAGLPDAGLGWSSDDFVFG